MLRAPYRQTTLDTAGREYEGPRRIQQGLTTAVWLRVGLVAAADLGLIAALKRKNT